MKNAQAEFGARLRAALLHAQVSESSVEIARAVPQHGGDTITPAAAHRWIKGQSIPRARNMKALATWLRLPVASLYEDADVKPARSVRQSRLDWNAGVVDQHAIEAFLSLDDQRRRLVRELITALADAAAPRSR